MCNYAPIKEMKMKKRITIKQRSAYPIALRQAALATWSTTASKSAEVIADEYNVHFTTIARWVREAGLQRGTNPNATAANKARRDYEKANKDFNTPKILADGTISYQGRIYR